MKAKAKTASKISKRQKIVVVVGVFAALAAVAYLLSAPVLEKKKFENAASELETLASEIQTKIGPADEIARDKSCGRASRKFKEGPLSCSVSITMLYNKTSADRANEIMFAAASNMGGSPQTFTPPGKPEATKFISKDRNRHQDFSHDMANNGGLSCGARYYYPEYPYSDVSTKLSNESLTIHISCGDEASAEHYKLRN